jgi:hypothetical protein
VSEVHVQPSSFHRTAVPVVAAKHPLRFLIVLSSALLVLAAACSSPTCRGSCSPDLTREHWIVISSRGGESAQVVLVRSGANTNVTGSGVLYQGASPAKSITIDGQLDPRFDAPATLDFTGWFASTVRWTRVTQDTGSDNVYGILHVPPSTSAGDTLGVFLRRRP